MIFTRTILAIVLISQASAICAVPLCAFLAGSSARTS